MNCDTPRQKDEINLLSINGPRPNNKLDHSQTKLCEDSFQKYMRSHCKNIIVFQIKKLFCRENDRCIDLKKILSTQIFTKAPEYERKSQKNLHQFFKIDIIHDLREPMAEKVCCTGTGRFGSYVDFSFFTSDSSSVDNRRQQELIQE